MFIDYIFKNITETIDNIESSRIFDTFCQFRDWLTLIGLFFVFIAHQIQCVYRQSVQILFEAFGRRIWTVIAIQVMSAFDNTLFEFVEWTESHQKIRISKIILYKDNLMTYQHANGTLYLVWYLFDFPSIRRNLSIHLLVWSLIWFAQTPNDRNSCLFADLPQ